MDTQVSTDMRSVGNPIMCGFITFFLFQTMVSSKFANMDIPTKHMINYYNMLIQNFKNSHYTVTSNGCMCYNISKINTMKGATVHIILPTQYFYTWVLIG